MIVDSEWSGQLEINIKSAHGVKVADIASSDPYVVCVVYNKFDDRKVQIAFYKTEVKKYTVNPKWDESFEIPLHLSGGSIVVDFDLWDSDVAMKDDYLGRCECNLENKNDKVLDGRDIEEKLLERDRNEGIKGKLIFSVKLKPVAPRTTNQYKVYNHKATGLARAVSSASGPRCYNTYKIWIHYVPLIFGETKQHWNVNYDAAQKIFGNAVIKNTIQMQHSNLYSNHSKAGVIYNGEDFLNLLHYGILGGCPRFFTYALMDNAMFFSETGADFFSDFTSKHAMHSNVSEEVRYAGEFHFRKNEADKYRLVIDNNSGTFGPNPDDLDKLKRVMEYNLPGLEVEAISYKDPKLKEYKDEFDQLKKASNSS